MIARIFFFLLIVLVTQCQQKRADDKVIENSSKYSTTKLAEVAFQKTSLKAEQIVIGSNDSTLISPHSGKAEYDYAYNEINQMLIGQKPKDLKLAVFLVENAYLEGKLDYSKYCQQLDTIKTAVKRIVKDKTNYQTDKLAYNYAIFNYMKEASKYNNGRTYDYDFDDYLGLKDKRKVFVTKLLDTRKGNCHSLPMLYKILANEMGVDAHLAIAPMHMYIKHLDYNNQWLNLELTSADFPSDGHIMSESGISIEAVKNEIYMHPMNEVQTIAYCILYLAQNYYRQYGAHDFVLEACNKSLEYYPELILAYLLKMQVYGTWLNSRSKVKGKSKSEIEYLKGLNKKLTALKNKVEKLGYKSITGEEYEQWQQQSDKQKLKELQAKN